MRREITVERAAYSLCKAVVSAPGRDQMRSLLRDFNSTSRGQLGYYARQFGGQFRGYLALDAARPHLNPMIGTLPRIETTERELLVGCHLELVALNSACVATMVQLQPGIAEAVDPYGGHGNDALLAGEAGLRVENPLLPADLVTCVSDAFREGPLCEGVRRGIVRFPILPNPTALAAGVDDLDRRLHRAGARKSTDDIAAVALQAPPSSPQRTVLEYLAALAGIRAALRLLDQLVFQAFQIDRLPAADNDNMVAVDGPSIGTTERMVTVTLQPTAEFVNPKPGELIMFAPPPPTEMIRGLCEVVATRHEMSRETGSLVQLSLHLVDENLNPSPLFRCVAGPSE